VRVRAAYDIKDLRRSKSHKNILSQIILERNKCYSARLDHLQLQSLERRRLIADLVLTYRIIFGLIDLNMSDYFTLQSSSGCSAATRGNPYKLLINHRRINVRNHSANVSLEFGTVYRQALLVLSHYYRLEILWVMST